MQRRRPEDADEVELCRQAKRGDRRAWRTLIRRHTPMVYRLAARMLGPGAEAEDVCQEVFMRAHRSFDSYDPSRPLTGWLGRITYNAGLRRLGQVQRAPLSADPAAFAHVEDDRRPSPEQETASHETGRLVLAAMQRLSAQDRALVTMRYVDELTDAEVGEAVGMNRNTVRTRLHRARLVLMRALAPVLGRS